MGDVKSNVMQAARPTAPSQTGGADNAKDAATAEMKISKDEAGFVKDGGYGDVNCGNCQFFEGGTCDVVEGVITPGDISNAFQPLQSRGSMGVSLAALSKIAKERTMFINRVSVNPLSGKKYWHATASGVEWDSYEERMSVGLFKDFIDRIERREEVPEPFSSESWNGGLPYLSVAHYLDLDGYGIAGTTEKCFIDGNIFKASGEFKNTPIGEAAYLAIKSDIENRVPDDQRVRISIAFLDMAHKHEGGLSFERKSLTDECEHCKAGVGGKTYEKGILIHLATTRVPAYKATEISIVERATMSKNKKSLRQTDAASIIGEELAEELEGKSLTLVGRSEDGNSSPAVVIKAEKEDEEGYKESMSEEEMEEEKRKKKAEEDEAEATKDIAEKKSEAEAPADSQEPAKVEEEADESDEVMKSQLKLTSLGDAKTLDEAEEFLLKNRDFAVTPEDMIARVICNLVDADKETVKAVQKSLADYQQRIDIQAVKAIESTHELLKRVIPDVEAVTRQFVPEGHALEASITGLVKRYDEIVATQGISLQEKFALVEEPYQAVAKGVEDGIKESVKEAPAQVTDIQRMVEDAVAPLVAKIAELEGVSAQKSLVDVKPPEPVVRRAETPPTLPFHQAPPPPTKAVSPLTQMIRRSVGLPTQ